MIFVILVPSKPSIVFSFQNPFYSQPLFLLVNVVVVVVVVVYFKAILLVASSDVNKNKGLAEIAPLIYIRR